MSGDIVNLCCTDYIDFKGRKLELSALDADSTYLTILNDEDCREHYTFLPKLVEESKELKILFKSKMAINRTPNHGQAPRNTLYIFEISDDYKQVVRDVRVAFFKAKEEAYPRFVELCKLMDKISSDWHRPSNKDNRLEWNSLSTKFGFSYYSDYKYKK